MKFGGTSVADPDAIIRLVGIVGHQLRATPSAPPVVVVSALAGVTDTLVATAQLAEDGAAERAASELQALLERHVAIATAVTSESRTQLIADVRRELEELIGLIHALAVLREVSPRSRDAVLAAGELASSRIVAAAIADRGIPSDWIDARTVLVTDAEHTIAAPDMIETCERARERVAPALAAGKVAVLGGFIGATPNGMTSTLGRGGSDYSAAIFGACLDVDEIQIWTDVDGVLTAELAYFGAKVLHPSTILPAVGKNIPVRILNSHRPENPGTRITADGRPEQGQLTAIACKRDVTVIDITSTRMLMAHGFLRRLFEVFERFKTAVDVVTTSEVSVSVTIDDTRRLEAILDNLRNFAEASCEREMAIICAVGENLRADPTVFGRAVTSLDRIPLRLVSQAASRRNITFVLRDADVPQAMTRLHEQFFGRQ